MRTKILLYTSTLSMIIILGSALSNASHSPGAKTGSPADGANCNACHTGAAQVANSWITSTIPITGYAPGTTYTITLTGTHTNVAKFGFELTAEDASNAKKGNFIITNSIETQLANMMQAVGHTGNGLTPTNNSKTWSFDWTAPAPGTGAITFYASLNAADGNNGTSGDVVYITNTVVAEDLTAGFTDGYNAESLTIFPIPTKDVLNIEMNENQNGKLSIIDQTGKIVHSGQLLPATRNIRINISNLPNGIYFLQIQGDKAVYSKQFIKL